MWRRCTTATRRPRCPSLRQRNIPGGWRACGTGARLELVARSHTAYMWSPPLPGGMLERHELVQRLSSDAGGTYQDALIYPKGYTMSRWEQAFYDLARRETQRAGQA